MVSSAITKDGGVLQVFSRGVTPKLFSPTPAGQQCSAVFDFCVGYTRHYGQQPSLSTIERYYPDWHSEFSPDPIEALLDEFLDSVNKRYFDAAVLDLSRASKDRSNWGKLDEILLDKARDVAAIMPTGGVSRFAAEMNQRIEQYEVEANLGYRPGMPLGIPVIDEVTDGIRTGWLTTFAGFSGLGKTTLSQIASLSGFELDYSVLFLSLEMSRREVMERLDTMVNHFPHKELVRRKLSESTIQNWREAARIYSKAHGEIVVKDRLGGCTIDRIHAEIQRYRPQIAVVDYIQRMSGTRHSMAKWEGLEEITNDLKTVAMDTDTAIIMVSQDGRTSADEGSTRTNAANSQSIYTASDLYIGMQQTEEMRALQKMRIKMLKFRHGPWGAEVDMRWEPATGHFTKFEDAMGFVKPGVPA